MRLAPFGASSESDQSQLLRAANIVARAHTRTHTHNLSANRKAFAGRPFLFLSNPIGTVLDRAAAMTIGASSGQCVAVEGLLQQRNILIQ